MNLDQMSLNQAQKEGFLHFFEFVSYAFLETAYNDSFWQCLTSKTQEKKIRAKVGPKELKSGLIKVTHSKTILENTAEIEPQPVALDFKNLSRYSSRSK